MQETSPPLPLLPWPQGVGWMGRLRPLLLSFTLDLCPSCKGLGFRLSPAPLRWDPHAHPWLQVTDLLQDQGDPGLLCPLTPRWGQSFWDEVLPRLDLLVPGCKNEGIGHVNALSIDVLVTFNFGEVGGWEEGDQFWVKWVSLISYVSWRYRS